MSEPVTNVEIEDVLSSIRRLVSDGDKARTRDSAPVHAAQKDFAPEPPEPAAAQSSTESDVSGGGTDKLVLTPAFLVVDADVQPQDETRDVPNETNERVIEQDHEGEQDNGDDQDHVDEERHESGDSDEADAPLELTNMVWDAPEDTIAKGDAVRSGDRSGLVATIAELEAAISADTSEFEPDGSEDPDTEDMTHTIAWPGAFKRASDDVEDAETADDDVDGEVDHRGDTEDLAIPFQHREAETDTANASEAETVLHRAGNEDGVQEDSVEVGGDATNDATGEAADEYGDDDLDGLLEVGGVTFDDEALRAMIADVVREELSGALGERITRNVRKLVRREIYRVLSSQEFD